MKKMNEAAMTNHSTRLQGLLILFAIITPMFLAYIIFHTGWGIPSTTTNKGDLLTRPQPIQQLQLTSGEKVLNDVYLHSEKRWRILIPVTASCEKLCQQFLYLSRQVHIRLAQKAYRVERILLLLDDLSDDQLNSLKRDHPETLILHGDEDAFNDWLAVNPLPKSADNYFYLLDQEGFAMMRYGSEHKGQDVLDDLKKLLKFTYDK